jgi:hypothetical protein
MVCFHDTILLMRSEVPNITIAEQDHIDTFSKEVDRVLSAIGHPEALVTDESQVGDFTIHIGVPDPQAVAHLEGLLGRSVRVPTHAANDPEIDRHNARVLDDLAVLMGRPVKEGEYLWRLAQELHETANPPTRH